MIATRCVTGCLTHAAISKQHQPQELARLKSPKAPRASVPPSFGKRIVQFGSSLVRAMESSLRFFRFGGHSPDVAQKAQGWKLQTRATGKSRSDIPLEGNIGYPS
jgi:hypothetical protein